MEKIPTNSNFSEKQVIDISLKLVLVLLLVTWCVMIILPFVTILLWSIILAITLFPLYNKLVKVFGGKKILAATLVSLAMLLILLVPVILMISALAQEAQGIAAAYSAGTLRVPPPDPKVADWPLIGSKLFKAWSALNQNMEAAILEYSDQLKAIGQKALSSLMNVTSNVMMFTASIIIAGVFMATTEQAERSTLLLFKALTGNMGEEFMKVVIQTIRNVSKGIIGVAFIQFALMGILFLLAGVPLAGLWALIVLMLALVQLPGSIVAIPVIIYIYSVKEPVPATLWAVLILLAGLSDNVLKPWLMGMGAPVPMLVIFLGSIGGFILSGFIGLFTGAIILSLGYKLGGIWMEGEATENTTGNIPKI